nr:MULTISPECIES: SDR family NAD(P)-dependent oxidoreductase [unclassified Variovorax]
MTGDSRGIGRMVAEGFLAQGARVYISARKAAACDLTAQEFARTGHCVSLPYDVSTVAGCQALADAYAQHEPTLDILINNAGAAWGEDLDALPESGWDKVADLNMKTPFFLTKALSEPLRAAARARVGKIINISSTDGIGLNPQENYSYVASNAGLIHLTRRMALGQRSASAAPAQRTLGQRTAFICGQQAAGRTRPAGSDDQKGLVSD